ncbi:MAG TPA: GAF domain-containing protein, partial [Chloroflexi bacterium]|nr:GAF domain-containing protein [Chloroflexota bacterium]
MTMQGPKQNWFRRLFSVESPDPYQARLAWLFNISLLSSLLFFLLAAGLFSWITASLELGAAWALMMLFFSIGMALTLLAFWLNKRGHYAIASQSYITFLNLIILLSVLLIGGTKAPTWPFFIWGLVMISIFISYRLPLYLVGVLVALWGLLAMGEHVGVYQPLVTVSADHYAEVGSLFAIVAMVLSVPFVANNLRYTQQAVQDLRGMRGALETAKDTLEEQVALQTAEARQRAKIFRAVADLGRITASILELQPLLKTAVDLIAQRFDYYRVNIFLLDEDAQWAVLQASSLLETETERAHELRLRVGREGIVGYVASSGVSYVGADVAQETRYRPFDTASPTRSEVAIPLELRGKVIGVLDVEQTEPGAFDQENVALLQALADSLAVAIENAMRFKQLQRTLKRLLRYEEQEVLKVWREMLLKREGRLGYLYDRVRVEPLPEHTDARLGGPADVTEITTWQREDGMHLL